MKTLRALSRIALVLLLPVCAMAWLTPSNPTPQIELLWNPSPDADVVGYNVYYGSAGSRMYTNRVSLANVTSVRLTEGFTRGESYYFAATAVASDGLESNFSNELVWRPKLPPGAPGSLRTNVTTVSMNVESAPTPDGPWSTFATLGTDVTAPGFFRGVVSICKPQL